MRKALVAMVVGALVGAAPAAAQTSPDLVRVEWLTGMFFHGSMADASFQFDTTPFGGIFIERDGGSLDVDPKVAYGVRMSYRLAERVQVLGGWQHAEGRYRTQFPAEASDEGDFDLEALILSTLDFLTGGTDLRASSAMTTSKTDVYTVALRYEIPAMRRWMFPFVSVGGGVYRERSDGQVFQVEWESEVPPTIQIGELAGRSLLDDLGVSAFDIHSTDWLLTVSGGLRASLSSRWGVEVEIEDLVRLNPDLAYLDAASTDPPSAIEGRLFQTTFSGSDGPIHNFAVRIAFNYAVWPYGAPR